MLGRSPRFPALAALAFVRVAGLIALAACSRPAEVAPAPAQGKATSGDGGAPVARESDGADAGVAGGRVLAPEAPPVCEPATGLSVFTSPVTPVAGIPVRVVAVSDRPLTGQLGLVGSDGHGRTTSAVRRGGPPYFWLVEVASPPAGVLVASFSQSACATKPEELGRIEVKKERSRTLSSPRDGVWPARGAWTHTLENVYSAWIEALFDAPEGELPTWPALHEVLRDPARNFLHDHFGAGEDSSRAAPVIRPDCADLPYFLRAYFAWKLRLPFGLGECSRGGGGRPPACQNLFTNEDADEAAEGKRKDGGVAVFGAFLRGTVANKAHSGSARTPFEDEASDYYPVPLTWESLRPGTVYADPYGHVLVLAKRFPQTEGHGGALYAVDGQPDGTVARKRFWRGNFLYVNQPALGGPGFKHFRPLVRRGGRLARLDDEGIKRSAEYGDLSRDPGKLDVEGFYDAMDDVLSPRPLDPQAALKETIDALDEQVRTRVQSVDNGRKWLERSRSTAPMPEGPEIFETTGVWEDFSTPSRDLRLLIAIDVVRGFPARVARRPERYAMPPGRPPKDVEADLQKGLERELAARSVTYTRTDGSPFTLTLTEVVGRATAFETTYNPNDCVESRWGAPAGSAEAATCRSRAPAEQQRRMEAYRPWFHDRRRPPRR